MKVTFLGQGYEALSELSVGNQLIKFFADERFHTFTGISAFSSQAGVNGLAKRIAAAKHLNSITIITGIDQEVVRQFKKYFEGLFAQSDPNLKKLSKKLIIELVKAKLVPTEAERKAAQNSAKEKSTEKVGNNIAALFPKRAIPKIPNAFKRFALA